MNSCQSRVNLVMNSCQYYDSRGEGKLCWCVYYTWVVTVLCMSTEPLLLRLGRSRKKVRTWSGKSGLFTDLAIYIHTWEIASRSIRDTQSRLFCGTQSPPLVRPGPRKSPKKVDRKNHCPDMVRKKRTVSGPFSEISPVLSLWAI